MARLPDRAAEARSARRWWYLVLLIVNIAVAVVLTWVFNAASAPAGADETAVADYTSVAA
jgi:hypothetical protein